MSIVAGIEEEFGKLPPRLLSIFLDAATIEKQAAALCRPWSDLKSTIVPMQPKGNGSPAVLHHGAGGGKMFAFNGLVRCLKVSNNLCWHCRAIAGDAGGMAAGDI